MDRIRYFAELSVRRATGFGLLAIGLVAVGLSFDPALAARATAILLTLEAAILWRFSLRSDVTPFRRREVWLLLDGEHGLGCDRRAQRVISEVMRETFDAWSRRLAGPAAACWTFDLAVRLLE